jgi:hypothetical protein
MIGHCGMCGRLLSQPQDDLSSDCGGDCWGCVSEIEADGMGVDLSAYRVDPNRYLQAAITESIIDDRAMTPLQKWLEPLIAWLKGKRSV